MMTWMHHERHRAPVDLPGGDRRDALAGDAVDVVLARRDAAQVEQREAERRVHERGLHVDAEQHAEPDQVDAELVRRPAPSSGTMMKASSKKSRKNARKKISMLTTIRKPSWPPGRLVSRCSTQRSPLTPWKVRQKTARRPG